MKYIEEYFRDKNGEVSFIEIKEDASIYINETIIKSGLSLPVMTKDLIEKIHTKDIEEIEINYFIDGMIFILGVDPSFKYNESYKDILKNYDKKIIEHILYKAIKFYDEEDFDKSAIYSRALLSLDEENKKGLFNYSLVLEKLGIIFMEKQEVEKSDEFIDRSSQILNKILKIDDRFELAYYKLGYHYKYLQNFLKAKLIWKKFIEISSNDLLIQEIREELLIIEDDSNLEVGITYLNYLDFEKALKSFLKLMPKHGENWNINYLIGQSYNGLDQVEEGIKYMSKALEENKEEKDIYNSLGSMYINIGDINSAIKIFTMGIEKFKEDYSLYFNRGISFIGIEDYKKAIIDMKKANELNPSDDNISAVLEDLKGDMS